MCLVLNSCFKKTHNTLWRQSQVMKCGFTGMTQHSNTSSLKYQSMFAISFQIYGVVYLWMCFTRSKCKPTLLHWHLIAPVGKCHVEMTWLHALQDIGSYTMTAHLLIMLCLCIKLWLKNDCHSTLPLPTMSCAFFLFPKFTMILKRRFNITIIQQKLWAVLSSKRCTSQNALNSGMIPGFNVRSSKKLLWVKSRPNCCYGEINSLWKVCEHSM